MPQLRKRFRRKRWRRVKRAEEGDSIELQRMSPRLLSPLRRNLTIMPKEIVHHIQSFLSVEPLDTPTRMDPWTLRPLEKYCEHDQMAAKLRKEFQRSVTNEARMIERERNEWIARELPVGKVLWANRYFELRIGHRLAPLTPESEREQELTGGSIYLERVHVRTERREEVVRLVPGEFHEIDIVCGCGRSFLCSIVERYWHINGASVEGWICDICHPYYDELGDVLDDIHDTARKTAWGPKLEKWWKQAGEGTFTRRVEIGDSFVYFDIAHQGVTAYHQAFDIGMLDLDEPARMKYAVRIVPKEIQFDVAAFKKILDIDGAKEEEKEAKI